MDKRAAFIASVAVLFGPVGALAAEPRVLAPISEWTLDYADERCSLIRDFGDDDETVRLQVDSFGSRFGYRVMITGDLVQAPAVVPITEVRVGYSPDTLEREQFYAMAGKSGDQKAVSFTSGFLPDVRTLDPSLSVPQPSLEQMKQLDRINGEFARGVTHMTIQFGVRKPLQLATGSMAAPFTAMHRCVDDLVASWGLDPAQQRALSRRPLPHPETVREVERNYPPTQAGRGLGAFVPVRVMVDEAGQATRCVVQVAVVDEAFRESACKGLSGSYEPALDAEGRPVASVFQVSTIYQVASFR